MAQVQASTPITRDDIEAKLRQIQHGAEAGAEAARGAGMAGGIIITVALVLLAYFIGKRRGRKKRTIVEIMRI
jgi:hypothetical protein